MPSQLYRNRPEQGHYNPLSKGVFQINIVDISQTVMHDFFTMIMLVDTVGSDKTFDEIGDVLHEKELQTGLSIRIQREDIFHAMHRI